MFKRPVIETKRVKHISTFDLICSGQLRKTGREFPSSESFYPNIKDNVWAFTERRWLIPLPTHSILPPVGRPLIHSREQRRRETAFKPAMD